VTSLPSPPQLGALPALPPLPGRESGAPGLQTLAGLLDGLEAETGRAPLARVSTPGEPVRNPLDGYIRSDGSTPLDAGNAARLADALATAMRQNPSHPLQRELQQLPSESVRPMLDFIARYAPAGREVPAHVADALLQAARPGAEARAAEVRTLAEGARQLAPAPPGPGERAAGGVVVRDALPGRAEEAGARTATTAPALRAMSEAGLPPGQQPRPGSEAATGASLAGSMARQPSATPGTDQAQSIQFAPTQRPTTPATGAAVTATTAGVPQEQTIAQGLPARVPGEGAAPPGRADVAPATPEGIGLPGSGTAAAGLSMAAVVQPAGTTFAHAPTTTPRTRMRDQAREARATRASEEQARDGQDRDQRRQPPPAGRAPRDRGTADPGRGGDAASQAARSDARPAGNAAPSARTRATSTAATTLVPAPGPGAPAGSASDSRTDGSIFAAAPPGTTAQAATRTRGSREPPTEAPAAPAAAARSSAQAARACRLEDAAAEGGEPGHAPGPGGNRRLRRQQWLYWSLIVVTYACLAGVLATLLPHGFELPIGEAHRPYWRHGLTVFGLVTGLAAWWVARRSRWTA